MIHTRLERSWCIGKAKRHYQKLIVPIVTTEGSLVYILCSYTYLMVARAKIVLREVNNSMKLINAGNQIPVFNSSLIKGTIIYTHPKGAILLLHQHY